MSDTKEKSKDKPGKNQSNKGEGEDPGRKQEKKDDKKSDNKEPDQYQVLKAEAESNGTNAIHSIRATSYVVLYAVGAAIVLTTLIVSFVTYPFGSSQQQHAEVNETILQPVPISYNVYEVGTEPTPLPDVTAGNTLILPTKDGACVWVGDTQGRTVLACNHGGQPSAKPAPNHFVPTFLQSESEATEVSVTICPKGSRAKQAQCF